MPPYALCFFNTNSVAFLGVWMPVSPVQCNWFEYKIHICAIVVGVRLHFSSYALLASSSQLFSCAGRTCLLGSSTFGVWTGGQGPLLAVEHKTAVESSMKNNYSLGLQNSMPGKWHNQIQPTICWKYGPSIHMLRQKFL